MPKAKAILTRVVLGAIMTAGVVGVLVVDHLNVLGSDTGDVRGLLLAATLLVLAFVAFFELRRLAAAAGAGLLTVSGLAGVAVLGAMPFWVRFSPSLLLNDLWAILGLIVLAVFTEQVIRFRVGRALERIGATLLAVLYLGVGVAIILSIRLIPEMGIPAVALFLAAVKFTDIGAYFTGIAIGRHKLIAWLSPGKTWEGLLGGLIVAAGVSILVVWLCRLDEALDLRLPLWKAAVFGAVVGLAGQLADLCESLLKRCAQVKDSGALIPEFGGVLDVLDSPLLGAPVAYVLLAVLL